MQIRMKEDMTRDESLMLLEVANAEVDSLRQQLDDAHQIIAHQAKLNEAAWENIGVLREALWVATEHNALHLGESHSTVIQGRAALAQGEA